METNEESDLNDLRSSVYTFPSSVQNVIDQVLSSDDPLDEANFTVVNYINSLFPTEQSLSNIDDVMNEMEQKIHTIDKEMSAVVCGQTDIGQDGKAALEDAQKVIKQLFVHIKDIKDKAEQSEEEVKEITRDIKQLDFAKRNLVTSITTLNHLHMLVEGADTLKTLIQKKQYGEIILPLQAVTEVMQHFNGYMDIPEIKQLSDEVRQIHIELAQQITTDFKEAFSGQNPKYFNQLTDGCLVLSLLDPKVKKDLLTWFIDIQLKEYAHIFDENQDYAWLDKIDKRYAWLKKHLLDFESKFGSIFPSDWEVSERIAIQFCYVTNEALTKLMHKRRSEIDVKLLLYAIQRTANFESLLAKRFTGNKLSIDNAAISVENKNSTVNNTDDKTSKNPFEESEQMENQKSKASPFINLIGSCFEPYLYIYIDSLDRNLADLMNKFVSDYKAQPPGAKDFDGNEGSNSVLSSCADLFVFYKKCILQCTQLSTGIIMLSLAKTFQKYLREYAMKILQNNLPKSGSSLGISTSMSSITRDFRDLSTSGFIQNVQNFLKEGENTKFCKEEQARICCILTTAEYCLETTQQLEEKLREKTDQCYAKRINLSQEQDIFHDVISDCILLLVQDLEAACDSALSAMTKMQWSSIETVGDQSNYVNTIVVHLRQMIPTIRDRLSSCRKYFTQLCVKFANSFIPKLVQQLYKCKPLSAVGAEQLLLDVYMLKTALLELPCTGYQIPRKAPASYAKIVDKGMANAEMILKIVMSPVDSPADFVKGCKMHLPDLQAPEFQKILDMKGLKRTEQVLLTEQFKQPEGSDVSLTSRNNTIQESPEHEAGRIRKLEKLIKKRI
ncbi:vacuolar protein sorting-associated protein 53 homolog [Vespula pensylvanica]|uniref:vacuolar protein sorting-associated protein 53 homolog n=1 Tax=Vespula pensylvanica TaxID=30213 RepID=UPI001CBA2FDA|nr:vacuolar protein sorting-associated protein 53 homolog [Vespula pensylvanica]XP_043683654.1 vacuolar protein sorting-associated protein 53 homolog [Vespula pensylvanica]XP_043683655.1 vacuolar protein sorting-associated protein 53 homolog [Vespula pensylvanica]XP_043683656.1 vacuolar protein sorting-associated protein 53 homolog [Vespula pensylvanica]XP_043683657.1 vacuolar protein sorting-associated protein 53 homolog [Vespula pensylvanica]